MSENQNMPDVVYHYTTMGTMMKIAETACIWATSINYLNDISEGEHFRDLVRKRIPEYLATHKVHEPSIFDDFINGPTEKISELRPCVASFSEDGDSLPQWRSYCSNGNGVAIGFRVDCLNRSFPTAAVDTSSSLRRTATLEKVEYLATETAEAVDREIGLALETAKNAETTLSGGDAFQVLMLSIACSKKHISFSNEREFRLVVMNGLGGNPSWLEFRPSRSTLVPYVSLSIPRKCSKLPVDAENTGQSGWDFINRIVIGPSPNKELSKSAVELFFRKLRMQVEVVSSESPYRDW